MCGSKITAVASTYLHLGAEALGLGSCWVQIRERDHSEDLSAERYVQNLLGIPQDIKVESVVAIGYKEKENRPFDASKLQKDRIHIETFKK